MSDDDDPQANEWDVHADGWDANTAARAYASAAFETLQRVAGDAGVDLAGAQIIDFGCGTGLLTDHLVAAQATVDAVDTSPAMLAQLDAKIAQHDWGSVRTRSTLPDAQQLVDLVVCSSVCSFLDDYLGTVSDLALRLRRGGLFVQWDWEQADGDSHGLTRTEIREALAAAGLVGIEVTDAFTITVDGTTMSPIMGHARKPT